MKEKLTQLLQEGKDRIAAVRSEAELQEVRPCCWASRAA